MTQKTLIAVDAVTNKEYEFKIQEDGSYVYENEKLSLKIENTDDGFTMMTVNDKSYFVEIVSDKQNEFELLINGIGYCFTVETPFSLQRKKTLVSQSGETSIIRLKAPMPGKILDVLVKTGDMVKAGDTLLILEAMKMQNAILASTKGTIKKVHVKEGNTTSKSDLLIELEKE